MDLSDASEKIPIDTTGDRSGDLPTSSAAPQPLRYARPTLTTTARVNREAFISSTEGVTPILLLKVVTVRHRRPMLLFYLYDEAAFPAFLCYSTPTWRPTQSEHDRSDRIWALCPLNRTYYSAIKQTCLKRKLLSRPSLYLKLMTTCTATRLPRPKS
jgi:hypothetical protein